MRLMQRAKGVSLGFVLLAVAWPRSAAAQSGPYQFVALTPCRIVDTRLNGQVVGQYGPILQSGTERQFPIQGNCGVPVGATAVAVNITAVTPTNQGRLTAYPSGIATPLVSSINFPAGTLALANGALVPLADQSLQPNDMAIMPFVVNSGQVHMVLDVAGYFTTPGGGTLPFHAVSPCRLVDTRINGGGVGQHGPILDSGVERKFPVQGTCGVPVGAKAVAVNLTAVSPTNQGRLTAYPSGIATPGISSINFAAGTTALANGAIVPVADQSLQPNDLAIMPFVVNSGQVHMVLDVTGYFE
jgi:hypothetical protein